MAKYTPRTFLMAGLVVVGLVLGHHTVRAEGVENNSADAAYKSDAVAETINTNVQKRTVLHQMVLKNLDESFDQLVDTLKQAVIKKESLQEARDAIPMPGLYEWLALLREYVSSFFMASAQEQAFNQSTLNYLTGNPRIGPQRANPYIKGALSATANLYKNYVKYFCIPGTLNGPAGCGGSSTVDNGYFAPNLVKNIVGDSTFSHDSMTAAADFVRAYFGITPDQIDTSRAQLGSFVDQQRALARVNLRLSALNRLMARRAPFTGANNTNFVGALFKVYLQGGYIFNNHPEAACSKPATALTPIEQSLCAVLNKNNQSSKVVADRVMQYELYMDPHFLDTLYSHDSPSRGAMDRMEIAMKAQQLAQDYQYLRDLQMYTALRASAIASDLK